MFPSQFEYFAPPTIEDALALLAERGEDAKVLAGGQSLIPLMKLRFAAPPVIVDVNRIPGLDSLEEVGGTEGQSRGTDRQSLGMDGTSRAADGPPGADQSGDSDGGRHLRVGALVRNRTLERSQMLASRYPTVATAAPLISDPIVRNQGTLVGSLCHADPQGDFGSVMLALEAHVVARSTSGERRIPITEFFEGPFATALRPDELAVAAGVPAPGEHFFGTYLKLERKVGDFATVGVALFLSMDGGRINRAGIGLTGVGPTNIKAIDAERSLLGAALSRDAIDEAARLAAAASEPRTDVRGSADYKREMVRVFVTRGLREAADAQALAATSS